MPPEGVPASRARPVPFRLPAAGAAGALQAPLEALHPAAGVDQLLLARVERVAVRADLDVHLGPRRPRLELVPAGAADGRKDVLGVDFRLHREARIAAAVSVATLPPETTQTTVALSAAGILPAISAATAVAPAGSQASFARS